MKKRIMLGFLVYGVVAGFLSCWWWHISDSIFYPNIPGDLLGQSIYNQAIAVLGDSGSAQAHYTIPWILRIPQIFVPASIIIWGLSGVIIQLILNQARKKLIKKAV
jgi:hypothetical protein